MKPDEIKIGPHFWWSDTQDRLYRARRSPRNFCVIDGVEREYTLADSSRECPAVWPDMVYLGEGEYSHCLPIG